MKQDRRSKKELRATAFHEAGHVVGAILYEIPFEGVTIERGEGTDGKVSLTGESGRYWEDPEVEFLEAKLFADRGKEAAIRCLLFGPVTEEIVCGTMNLDGAGISTATSGLSYLDEGGDYQKTIYLAESLLFQSESVSSYIEYLTQEVRSIVTQPHHWHAASRIAQQLLETRSLTADQCRAIFSASLTDDWESMSQSQKMVKKFHDRQKKETVEEKPVKKKPKGRPKKSE